MPDAERWPQGPPRDLDRSVSLTNQVLLVHAPEHRSAAATNPLAAEARRQNRGSAHPFDHTDGAHDRGQDRASGPVGPVGTAVMRMSRTSLSFRSRLCRSGVVLEARQDRINSMHPKPGGRAQGVMDCLDAFLTGHWTCGPNFRPPPALAGRLRERPTVRDGALGCCGCPAYL
jgi:hypothetical protein